MTAQLEPLDEFTNHIRSLTDVMDVEEELHRLRLEQKKLWALHEPRSGTWTHSRKRLVSALAVEYRNNWPEGKKITEDAVDQAAHNDPRYEACIKEAEEGRERFIALEADIAFAEAHAWALRGKMREEE